MQEMSFIKTVPADLSKLKQGVASLVEHDALMQDPEAEVVKVVRSYVFSMNRLEAVGVETWEYVFLIRKSRVSKS
jgi:hypothetical protein